MSTGYVGFPNDYEKIWLYNKKEDSHACKVRDVRWGDYLNILEQTQDDWSKIKWGKNKYFILSKYVDRVRPVEVIFCDVGQGDGCVYISSETGKDERVMVIDAGKANNMYNFLKWRFGKLRKHFNFEAAIITHPDMDHYGGFKELFKGDKFGFKHIYHNGLMERQAGLQGDTLGPRGSANAYTYLTDIVETDEEVRALYDKKKVRGNKKFPNLLFNGMQNELIGRMDMVSAAHGTQENGHTYLPTFAPANNSESVIEILGPVPETLNGKTVLRWFENVGKTKNGHSIILRLTVGKFRLLFGGDLNRPAEDYLLRHYSGIADNQDLNRAVTKARKRFEADVFKCCHHGASDVTNEFIEAVNAFGYIVSSGDNESHAHPRPDLLGRLGKLGRTDAPMIFCTEILRSTHEKSKYEDFKNLLVQSNVGVYGAVTVRTDGQRTEISFRLERKRGKQLWQSYILKYDTSKDWHIVSEGH